MSEPTSPTPTVHGAWRVVNGKLVDESTLPPVTPDVAPAALPQPSNSTRRKAPVTTE